MFRPLPIVIFAPWFVRSPKESLYKNSLVAFWPYIFIVKLSPATKEL